MSPEHLGSPERTIKHVFGSQSVLAEIMTTKKAGEGGEEERRKGGRAGRRE